MIYEASLSVLSWRVGRYRDVPSAETLQELGMMKPRRCSVGDTIVVTSQTAKCVRWSIRLCDESTWSTNAFVLRWICICDGKSSLITTHFLTLDSLYVFTRSREGTSVKLDFITSEYIFIQNEDQIMFWNCGKCPQRWGNSKSFN